MIFLYIFLFVVWAIVGMAAFANIFPELSDDDFMKIKAWKLSPFGPLVSGIWYYMKCFGTKTPKEVIKDFLFEDTEE